MASDLTYVAIATGFVYVAVILDAWSRRVVGFTIGRSLDARHAVAALQRAVALRSPLPGSSSTPIADRNTLRRSIAHSSPPTASSAR